MRTLVNHIIIVTDDPRNQGEVEFPLLPDDQAEALGAPLPTGKCLGNAFPMTMLNRCGASGTRVVRGLWGRPLLTGRPIASGFHGSDGPPLSISPAVISSVGRENGISPPMKTTVKALIRRLAALLTLPPYAAYRLGASLVGQRRAFPGWSQALALIPGLTGNYLRQAFYRWVLPRCGTDACVCFGTVFSHPTAEVGRAVYVGVYCSLGDVVLEDDVLIGSHVSITNGGAQHGIGRLDVPVRDQSGRWPRVRIGRDTWIGDRSVIMADVGAHCVIGAGSVVTRPIPDFAIAVGVPARITGDRRHVAGGPAVGTSHSVKHEAIGE